METVNRWWAWRQMAAESRKLLDNKKIEAAVREKGNRTADVARLLKKEVGCSGHSLSVDDPKMGGGFRIVGFIDFEAGKGVRVTRYGEETADGQNEVVRFTWSDFAKVVIHDMELKAEAEAFEPGKAKARRSAGKQQKGQEEKTMTMLAKTTETRALTLADYEARIHLYKEQIGTGYIGIGRTLIEAKEAKVVPHGQWETWVTETTGLTPRQAQRCMQAATEIRDGSAMARLEMSKALLLLSSGLDEEKREEIATKAVDEGATVKQLKEELRKAKLQVVQETGAATEIRDALKKAEEERERLEQQLRATESAYKIRINDEKEDAYQRGEMAGKHQAKVDLMHETDRLEAELHKQKEALEVSRKLLDSKKFEIEQMKDASGKEYEGLRNELAKQTQYAADLKRNQADLLAAAEDAEKRAADAEAELEALRAGVNDGEKPTVSKLREAVIDFLDKVELLQYHPEKLTKDSEEMDRLLCEVEDCCYRMHMAINRAAVEVEGAIE